MQLEDLENIVCSIELAERLKELGVDEITLFYWLKSPYKFKLNKDGKAEIEEYETVLVASPVFICEEDITWSAFTAAELGDMLPIHILVPNAEPFDAYRISITKFTSVDEKFTPTKNYIVNYECSSTECTGAEAWLRRQLTGNIYDPNLANAMAKMLIYLLENGLMKL